MQQAICSGDFRAIPVWKITGDFRDVVDLILEPADEETNRPEDEVSSSVALEMFAVLNKMHMAVYN